MTRHSRFTAPLGAIALLWLAACGGRHHLADYDFRDASLAVVSYGAPAPRLWTGPANLAADDPVDLVLTAGGRVAREVEARAARARLDSAASRVDVSGELAERTLERAALYLGARAGERDRATYLLEVDLDALGLDARGDRPRLYVEGVAILLDARTGREIWDARIHGHDDLAGGLGGGTLGDVLTAGTLRSMSVDDFERVLQRLTDYAADRVAAELRADLRAVRR